MKIELAKPYFDKEEQEAIAEVIASGWVLQGPRVREFEQMFAEYVGAKYAIATTSGTTALHAALSVAGIGHGDEVIVPSLSFIATANSVVYCGAVPVFVDIDCETCNIDAGKIEDAITDKVKAIMPVHQMGLPADLDAILELAKKHHLLVIEDAACAIGSKYRGKRIGGYGNIACFSFHPRKIITTGEGGMVTTDDPDIADKLRSFRNHGISVSTQKQSNIPHVVKKSYTKTGYNYRMTDIQAAMGIVQMCKLPNILKKRRYIAQNYNEAFSKIPFLRIPKVPEYVFHNYQSYWLEIQDHAPLSRDELILKLLERGIASTPGIMAIHKEPCYNIDTIALPCTERITSQTMIFPLYPSMTDEEVQYVLDAVFDILH